MEPFFRSDIYWLTIPFLTDTQRLSWIARRAAVQADAPDGTVATLGSLKIVYVRQLSPEMIAEAQEADLVFDFTRMLPATHEQATRYCTLRYPGKEHLRWIYPLDDKRPSFLHFYALKTGQSKIAAYLFCALFFLKRWVGQYNFTLHAVQTPLPEHTSKAMNASGYCIRLGVRGTTGAGRAVAIAYCRGTRAIAFGKYATTTEALFDLAHSRQALQEIHPGSGFGIPAVLKAENSLLITSSVRPNRFRYTDTLSPALVRSLVNFCARHAQPATLAEVMDWSNVRHEMRMLAHDARMEVKMMSQHLLKLMDSFDLSAPVTVSAAHGDLMPRNLYRSKDNFYIFGWALYARKRPLLFDIFHYTFQKNIYSGMGSSDDIRRELKGLKTHPDVLHLLATHGTTWEACLEQFLAVQSPLWLKQYISHSTRTVNGRETPSPDILDGFVREVLRSGNAGEGFYEALEAHLNGVHTYALLHFFHPSLTDTPAYEALTLALPKGSTALLVDFLKHHPHVRTVQPVAAGATTLITASFADGGSLTMNCIHRFQHKGLCYLSLDDLLRSRVTNGRRYVASIFFDFSFYVIRQTLSHAALQYERLEKFDRRARDEQRESVWHSTKNFWMNNRSTEQLSISANVRKYIRSLPMNAFSSRLTYRLHDLADLIKGLRRFPKVSLLPRASRQLATLPATTPTRRDQAI